MNFLGCLLGGVVESEDGGPKEKEKMVQVHHKVEIGAGRATSGKMLVELPIDVAALAPVKVLFLDAIFRVAVILLLVDPVDDVLMMARRFQSALGSAPRAVRLLCS